MSLRVLATCDQVACGLRLNPFVRLSRFLASRVFCVFIHFSQLLALFLTFPRDSLRLLACFSRNPANKGTSTSEHRANSDWLALI